MTDLFGNEEPAKNAKSTVYKNRTVENSDLVPAQNAQSMDYDFTKIRKTFHNGQWYFAYLDVIAILTDSTNPKVYSSALELRFLDLHELGCTVGIEQRKAFGRTQIDGVYDVVDGIVENTKQAFIDAFGAKAVTA